MNVVSTHFDEETTRSEIRDFPGSDNLEDGGVKWGSVEDFNERHVCLFCIKTSLIKRRAVFFLILDSCYTRISYNYLRFLQTVYW